jgi:hypothetical protein
MALAAFVLARMTEVRSIALENSFPRAPGTRAVIAA